MDGLDHEEKGENLDRKDHRENEVYPVWLVLLDNRPREGNKARLDNPDSPDHREHPDQQDQQDNLELLEREDKRDKLDQEENAENRVKRRNSLFFS